MKLFIISTLLGLSLAYKYNENKPPELNCDCGWKNEKITGGKEVEQIEYPWMANILKFSSSMFWCSGNIITEWHVLTSSHCMDRVNDMSIYTICVGIIGKTKCDKIHQAAFISKMPTSSNDKGINDIAIVTSATAIEFNSFVGPVCIPHNYIKNEKLKSNFLKILAWGATNSYKDMDMMVVGMDDCKEVYTRTEKSSHLCTYTEGYSTCEYDRGGGVVQLDTVTRRYTLIGMVTFSPFACYLINRKSTLSTNVSNFLSWMGKTVKQDKPHTTLCKRN